MSMRCFCLCLKLYLDLSWFEFGKYIYINIYINISQSNGLEMPCWESIETKKYFSRTAYAEIC